MNTEYFLNYSSAYQRMLENAETSIWFYSVEDSTLTLSSTYTKWLLRDMTEGSLIRNVPQSLFDSGTVSPESQKTVQFLVESISMNIEHSNCALKVIDNIGEPHWLHVNYTLVPDIESGIRGAVVVTQKTDAVKDVDMTFVRIRNQTTHMDSGMLAAFEVNLSRDEVKRVQVGDQRSEYAAMADIKKYSELHDAVATSINRFDQRLRQIQRVERKALIQLFDTGACDVRLEYDSKLDDPISSWISISVFMDRASVSKDICALIYINDIDPRKRAELELKLKAERDLLTNLYNPGAINSHIKQSLKKTSGNQSALLMIDIDNFRKINDVFGHVYGDAVLSEIATRLIRVFRRTDLMGRMGGDEFVVFLENIPSEEFAIEKAQRILTEIQGVHTLGGKEYHYTSSVGIAFAPLHGTSFDELYTHADAALYYAKTHGKRRMSIYHDGIDECDQLASSASGIEIYMSKNFNDNISEYVFQILYQAPDLFTGITSVLQLLGKHYDAQHLFVYAHDARTGHCTVVSEWWERDYEMEGSGWSPELSRDEFDKYYVDHLVDGPLHATDCDKQGLSAYITAPGVRSFIQAPMLSSNGDYKGFIAIEEFREARIMTREERDTVVFCSQIIATFLHSRERDI